MKFKVIHIITGLKDGGAESTLYNLITNSPNLEHIVISLTKFHKYGGILMEKGYRVYPLNIKLNPLIIFRFIYLIFLLRSLKPDIVQTWMYHADLIGGLAAYIANCKNIFWGIHHTSLDLRLNKITTIFVAYLNSKLSYFIPKKIITCAEKSKKVAQKKKKS